LDRPHDAPPSTRAPLRFAALCGLGPLLLGSVAFFGWLISTGGRSDGGEAFVILGIATLCGGFALLPAGLVALVVAWRRGASRSSLAARALPLLGNLPLALAYLLGTGVSAIQRVEVVNRSGAPIQDLELRACGRNRFDAEALEAGERVVWRFSPSSEGILSVSARQGERRLSAEGDFLIVIFDRWDVLVELTPDGEWEITETPGAPWSWVPDLWRGGR
jgi:hypothetical protein